MFGTCQLTLYEMPWVSDMATKLDSALTQNISPLTDYVADFRSKRDEASAASASITDETARDIFVEGLTTASIKQEL